MNFIVTSDCLGMETLNQKISLRTLVIRFLANPLPYLGEVVQIWVKATISLPSGQEEPQIVRETHGFVRVMFALG
jgi:hypothetical protein